MGIKPDILQQTKFIPKCWSIIFLGFMEFTELVTSRLIYQGYCLCLCLGETKVNRETAGVESQYLLFIFLSKNLSRF